MKQTKGILISVEGIDGCGKSTIVPFIYNYLKSNGKDVLKVRDPGTTDIGEHIRSIVKNEECSPLTELLLFSACRQELVDSIIKPALEIGTIVVSDRFSDSTKAYQGYYRGLYTAVSIMDGLVGDGIQPDYTLYLDITVEESIKRLSARTLDTETDKFDNIDKDFKYIIYNAFKELAICYPNRITTIDAMPPIEQVQLSVKDWLDKNILKRN